jgi:hypothetical protein
MLSLAAQHASATIIAHYTFEGDLLTSSDSDSGSSASAIASNAEGTQAGEFGKFQTEDETAGLGGSTSRAYAWSARSANNASNTFFSFTVSPIGKSLKYTTLTLDAKVFSNQGGTTAYDYDLYWSVDNYASAIDSSQTGPSIVGSTQSVYTPLSFDLSSLEPQTAPITFRLDPVSAGSNSGVVSQRRGSIDNIILNATVSDAPLLAQYDMTTLTITGQKSESPATNVNTYITAGDFTEELLGGKSPSEFGRANAGLIPAGVNGASARSMESSPSNPWWEFTITPKPGVIDLQFISMIIDAGCKDTISTDTNWDYELLWSIDSFTAILGTFDGPTTSGAETTATNLVIDLTPLAAQTSAVTFRIRPNRISGTNGTIGQRAGWIDNVRLYCSVTPPLKGTLILIQ